ncbi:unnamed protein product [Merluccius merluccius]
MRLLWNRRPPPSPGNRRDPPWNIRGAGGGSRCGAEQPGLGNAGYRDRRESHIPLHGSMLQKRKAQLIQLTFEKDLTHRFKSERKDALMRRFSLEKRRLPLY